MITGERRQSCVGVLSVRLNASACELETLGRLLNAEECARAEAFLFSHLRHSFIQSHGALRLLAGAALKIAPGDLRIERSAMGKPHLLNEEEFAVNMSHSGDLAVFAFCWGCQIGVDVEKIRPFPEAESIVERYFASEEKEEFRTMSPNLRERAFLQGWTRKEACIKAAGAGLTIPLRSFAVPLCRTMPPVKVEITTSGQTDAWWLQDVKTEPDYLAALAYSGSVRPVNVSRPISISTLMQSSGCGCTAIL